MPRRIFAIVGFLAAASVVSFLLSPKLRLQTTASEQDVVQSEEQVNQESDQSNPADPTMGTPDKELNSQEKKEILQKWSHLNNDTLSALTNMLNTRNDKIRKFKNDTKVALIPVNTNDTRLGRVLLNFRKVLPPEWKIQVYYPPAIDSWIRALEEVKKTRPILTPLLPNNLTYFGYDDLIRTRPFWEPVEGEHVLIFQTDAALCHQSPFKIIDFLEYSYVGAPWGHALSNCGNGGLSLRKRSVSLKAVDSCALGGHYEDGWYCNCFWFLSNRLNYEVKLAPPDISKHFSVETYTSQVPVGVHGLGRYWANTLEELLEFCPEARP